MEIKTSREAAKQQGRGAWLGEQGNPRTDQRRQIVEFDNVLKTRHTFDVHEKEQTARDEATFRPDGAADRLDPLQQMGRMIEPGVLMAKLRLCNLNLIFEAAGRPGFMNILIECDGLNIKTGESGRYKRFITSFDVSQPLPEFSIMGARMEERPTKDGQMTTRMKHAFEKTRGWRTVIAKLVAAQLITEPQVIKHFMPHLGRSSALWQKHMTTPIAVGGQ